MLIAHAYCSPSGSSGCPQRVHCSRSATQFGVDLGVDALGLSALGGFRFVHGGLSGSQRGLSVGERLLGRRELLRGLLRVRVGGLVGHWR
jgi:hypothetical protein